MARFRSQGPRFDVLDGLPNVSETVRLFEYVSFHALYLLTRAAAPATRVTAEVAERTDLADLERERRERADLILDLLFDREFFSLLVLF